MQKLIRLPEVMSRTGLSRSGVYQAISEGRLKKPIRIGKRATGFIESEIEKFIEDLIKASRDAFPNDELGI